ncbi:MAG: glycosyltransferase [bacterium]|nr:glycosyltransferase [bacterium]
MNSNKTFFLFCQYFPYLGGEQFLFNEVEYYPKDVSISVFTEHNSVGDKIELPPNFQIINEHYKAKSSVRRIVINYWKLILKIFFYELFTSPHRLRYFKNFKTHLVLLIGYLQKAEIISTYIPKTNDPITLYSYWFDEWATILNLVKHISKSKIKVICRTHAYDFDEAQVTSGYHIFRSFDLKGLDRVFSISEFGKKYIEGKYRKKIIYVEKLGVKFRGNNPVKIDMPIVIVSCSSLIPIKRVDLIIEILKKINLKITWLHFGGGPLESDILRHAKSLPTNIIFNYKSFVKNEEIIKYYNENTVDLFISTSELEGIPVSMMEAISFGIPIAGCNICGVPEIVNKQTGILYEKTFNVDEIAMIIQKFICLKSRDLNYRTEIKKYWENNYNGDKIYPHFIDKNLLNN